MMHLEEKTLTSQQVFDGVVVKLYVDKAEIEDGSEVTREVIRHPGGVCVLPLDEDGNILFVKQFRYPFAEVMTEIPAGKLEWGESHHECGLRELKEETGCTCDEYVYLGILRPTPAYCSETIHMYLAKGLHYGEQHLDEDEFLEVYRIPFDRAVEMVLDNEIQDAKTQLAILKAKAYLNR